MTEIENEERRLTEERGKTLFEQIQHKRLVDDQSFKELALLLHRVKDTLKALAPRFDAPVSAAHRSHQESLKLKADALGKFLEAEKLAKEKLANYLATHENAPEVEGVQFQTVWRATVTEEGLVPREYMVPDLKKLNAVAGRLRAQARIPGVKVSRETIVKVMSDEDFSTSGSRAERT